MEGSVAWVSLSLSLSLSLCFAFAFVFLRALQFRVCGNSGTEDTGSRVLNPK